MTKENDIREILDKIKNNIAKVLIGKNEVIDMVLAAYVAGGHVLIEDVPGLGKTTLVSALARSVDCSFQRIQFTPDVLPSDVAGYTSFDLKTGEKQVNFGGVMSQIVLADEINRTSPKTQSSLLEVMQENQVTIDGISYPVPQPFIVLATQNPVEQVGTYPLPEAQLDRFLIKIALGYPSMSDEKDILLRNKGRSPLEELSCVASADDIIALRKEHSNIICADPVMDYIVRIADATRHNDAIALGVSPRGSLALMNAAMAKAMLSGRNYTLPDDVQAMIKPVLAHRVILANNGLVNAKETPQQVLDKIIRFLKVPSVV
jgi:MoxR-like ATPase